MVTLTEKQAVSHVDKMIKGFITIWVSIEAYEKAQECQRLLDELKNNPQYALYYLQNKSTET